MALDEPLDSDEMIRHGELRFIMDRMTYEIAKPVKIDLTEEDPDAPFTVSSSISENNCGVAEDPSCCRSACQIERPVST